MQVQQAFHTEIHKYVLNGEEHWANASDPQIPLALTPVIAGITTLHNFTKKPQLIGPGQKFKAKLSAEGKPEFTSTTGMHALSPGDYWVIYNATPPPPYVVEYEESIAVVGRSNTDPQGVYLFRYYFLNDSHSPEIVVNGPDPGDLGGGEEAEAVLDSSWVITADPKAAGSLVVSRTTHTTDSVDLSEEYIIDQNLADVMTESFGLKG